MSRVVSLLFVHLLDLMQRAHVRAKKNCCITDPVAALPMRGPSIGTSENVKSKDVETYLIATFSISASL